MKRSFRKHGLSYAPEYRAWQQMRLRCLDPEHAAYASYGGRGITVCDRWREDPAAFIADLGPKPSPKHELDRIDNDKGYEPGNVRWATPEQQVRNTSRNIYLECAGRRMILADWSRETGIKFCTLLNRYRRGLPPERILLDPARTTHWRRGTAS